MIVPFDMFAYGVDREVGKIASHLLAYVLHQQMDLVFPYRTRPQTLQRIQICLITENA